MIPVNVPLLIGNEKKYLNECIDTGWISSDGPFVEKFEEAFKNYIGCSHAIAVSNGTDAIDIAIDILDLSEGDEVIIPTFTIISCVSELIRKGVKLVFVDCDPLTFNIDTNNLEKLITPKTKLLFIAHIYGLPCDMNEILRIKEKYDLVLIEDIAEVIGQTYYGKKCGSFADITVTSFYPNKHITTGEGGMILTNNNHYAFKAKEKRNLCFNIERRFKHYDLGWNSRMTNLQAALGLAQIENIDVFLEKKKYIGRLYNALFSEISEAQLPLKNLECADNLYWVYSLVFSDRIVSAKEFISYLESEGVGSRPFFYPLHKQPVLERANVPYLLASDMKNSEYIAEYGLYLPSGLGITEEQIEYVAKVVINGLRKLSR